MQCIIKALNMCTVTGHNMFFSATEHKLTNAIFFTDLAMCMCVCVDMQRLGAAFTSVGYPPSLTMIYSANTVSSTCIIRFCSTAGDAEGTGLGKQGFNQRLTLKAHYN